MSNQVAYMTHSVNREIITRLFAKFANRYGKIWTTRLGEGGDWNACADDWLEELQQFDLGVLREGVSVALATCKEYPPTLGQLIDLCLKASGVPEPSQLIRMMTAKDFSHPVVKMVYDKIGSWKLSNGSEKEIAQLVRDQYDTMVNTFKSEPQQCWQKLTDFNAKPKELPPPEKIPNKDEMKSFRECMTRCQEILSEKKIAGGGKAYKEFDANKIKQGHKEFDQGVFDEYKAYLIGIQETETMILPATYLMQRNKFLNMAEQAEWLKKQGYVPPKEREGFASPKGSDRSGAGKPVKVYKNWAHD